MDGRHFDNLTKLFAKGRSRRSLIKGLLGLGGAASFASIAVEETDARRGRGRANPPGNCPPGEVFCDGFCCPGNCFDGVVCCEDPTESRCGNLCCPEANCNDAEFCCSDIETACGSTCCEQGQACTRSGNTDVCCDAALACGYDCCESADQCCDNECCAPGSVCVAEETCCPQDQYCPIDPVICCGNGQTCCNDGCCDSVCASDGACCRPSHPSYCPSLEACCPPGQVCCNDGCCPNHCTTLGDCCIPQGPVDNVCTTSDQCCGGGVSAFCDLTLNQCQAIPPTTTPEPCPPFTTLFSTGCFNPCLTNACCCEEPCFSGELYGECGADAAGNAYCVTNGDDGRCFDCFSDSECEAEFGTGYVCQRRSANTCAGGAGICLLNPVTCSPVFPPP